MINLVFRNELQKEKRRETNWHRNNPRNLITLKNMEFQNESIKQEANKMKKHL